MDVYSLGASFGWHADLDVKRLASEMLGSSWALDGRRGLLAAKANPKRHLDVV